jgi:competence protein ComEA
MKPYISVCLILILIAMPALALLASSLVDINSAGSLELEKLYRVSPRLAGRIIAERENNGPYRSLKDLETRIKEIGPKTIARWEGQAAVNQP